MREAVNAAEGKNAAGEEVGVGCSRLEDVADEDIPVLVESVCGLKNVTKQWMGTMAIQLLVMGGGGRRAVLQGVFRLRVLFGKF